MEGFPVDPPENGGDRSILSLNADLTTLKEVFSDEALVEPAGNFCASTPKGDDSRLDSPTCSAGHTACYISPYGDVYPCVQFPFPCGNVRRSRFLDIWRRSDQLNEVRSIRLRDLTSCSQCVHVPNCTRCPGLAYMEGNMRALRSRIARNLSLEPGFPLSICSMEYALRTLCRFRPRQPSQTGTSRNPSASKVDNS